MSIQLTPAENSPEIRKAALCSLNTEYIDASAGRAALHVDPQFDFESTSDGAVIMMARSFEDGECNAIGSARHSHVENALRTNSGGLPELKDTVHAPILKLSRPTEVVATTTAERIIVTNKPERSLESRFTPSNLAGQIASSLGVELDVFQGLHSRSSRNSWMLYRQVVDAVTFTYPIGRMSRFGVAHLFSDTAKNNYLYLNGSEGQSNGLSWGDYMIFLKGLVELGVVDEPWAAKTESQHMAIVPAPWNTDTI